MLNLTCKWMQNFMIKSIFLCSCDMKNDSFVRNVWSFTDVNSSLGRTNIGEGSWKRKSSPRIPMVINVKSTKFSAICFAWVQHGNLSLTLKHKFQRPEKFSSSIFTFSLFRFLSFFNLIRLIIKWLWEKVLWKKTKGI